jgi:membrane-anchored glycerophosphoryl diester phosphodiesterase (GDPDase)
MVLLAVIFMLIGIMVTSIVIASLLDLLLSKIGFYKVTEGQDGKNN